MSEQEQFEAAMRKKFGDLVDLRTCINNDGNYMAWDTQVAWFAWQAATAQAQLGANEWMSVKDWLPADGVPVLIHAPNLRVPFLVGVRNAADLGYWYFPDEGNFLKMEYVGNWQLLPEPPQELNK